MADGTEHAESVRIQGDRLFAYILIAFFALCVWIPAISASTILQDNRFGSAVKMLNGTAEKPFVYRRLLPIIANAISFITPEHIRKSIGEFIDQSAGWRGLIAANTQHFPAELNSPDMVYAVCLVIAGMYGFLVLYGVALYHLSLTCFPHYNKTNLALSTALFGIFSLLLFIDGNIKIYDFPVLGLSAACLLFLLQQKWKNYGLAFMLFCINKETALYQTGLFILLFWKRMQAKRFLFMVLLQLVAFTVITLSIRSQYIHNAGGSLFYQGMVITKEIQNFSISELVVFLAVAALIFGRWRDIPSSLRQSVWLLPISATFYAFFGWYGEYRVFFEALPGLTVIAGYTLFAPRKKAAAIQKAI